MRLKSDAAMPVIALLNVAVTATALDEPEAPNSAGAGGKYGRDCWVMACWLDRDTESKNLRQGAGKEHTKAWYVRRGSA